MNYEKYRKRAEIIKAMAHPARLIVIEALKDGELCVCELNELVELDQSTLSRHLSPDFDSNLNCLLKLTYY